MAYEVHILNSADKLVDLDGHYPDYQSAERRAHTLAERQAATRAQLIAEFEAELPAMLCDENPEDPTAVETRLYHTITECLSYRYIVHSCGTGPSCILWDAPTVE